MTLYPYSKYLSPAALVLVGATWLWRLVDVRIREGCLILESDLWTRAAEPLLRSIEQEVFETFGLGSGGMG